MERKWFIGVDGGGTKTTAVAINQEGQILAKHTGKGINFYALGMAPARSILQALLRELCAKAGANDYAAVFIGMSALDGTPSRELVQDFCGEALDVDRTEMFSDVLAGLYGLTLGHPGIMLISGTGMIGMAASENGAVYLTGGWGYALGDEGSCFYIGQEGLRAAIRSEEKTGAPTLLEERARIFYQCQELREIIPKIYAQNKVNDIVASFAQEVIQASRGGDRPARRIIKQTLTILLKQAESLMRKINTDHIPVGVYGGLFEHNPDIFQKFCKMLGERHPGAEVMFPPVSPEVGAVLCGLSLRKPENWKTMQENIASAALNYPEKMSNGTKAGKEKT